MENINLSSTHIDVIAKLHEIAEKHGARISIWIASNHFENDIGQMTFDGLDDGTAAWLDDNGTVESAMAEVTTLNFEMTDKEGNHHGVSYVERSGEFSWSPHDDEYDERAIEFITSHEVTYEWEPGSGNAALVSMRQKSTEYYGFGGKTYGEVYRMGIALKMFASAVCDFLGEPEIKVTYP